MRFVLKVLMVSVAVAAIGLSACLTEVTILTWLDRHSQFKDFVGWSVLGLVCLAMGTIIVSEVEAAKKRVQK